MKVVPNWVILVITVLVFTIAFGGTYFLGRRAGSNAAELSHTRQENKALNISIENERKARVELETERERLRIVSGKLQDALNGKDVVYDTVTKTIVKEVEKPVYRDARLPSSGVHVLSDAAEQLNATRSTKD